MAERFATYYPLAIILALAAALQGFMLFATPTVSADGIIFIRIARELNADPVEAFRTNDQHPGYPAMLLAATRVVECFGYQGDPEAWMAGGRLISFICGLLSVAVVWLFARSMFDARLANVAAICFSVLPVPRWSSVDAQSDTPHVLLYLVAVWLASVGITNGNVLLLAGAGAASGLAYWIRPEGLEVALVALPFLVWQAYQAGWGWRRMAIAVGTLAGAAAIIAAPYPILAGKITSKQLPFAKATRTETFIEQQAKVAALKAAETKQPALVQQIEQPVQAQPIEPSPAAEISLAATPVPEVSQVSTSGNETAETPPPKRFTAKFVFGMLGKAFAAFIYSICQGLKFVFIPCYLLGNVCLYWRRPPMIQIFFLIGLGVTHIAILMSVYILSGYIAHRHVIPLVALAIPFAALAILQASQVFSWLCRVRPAWFSVPIVTACCLAVLPYTLRPVNHEFKPVIAATRWIAEQTKSGEGVVTNSPYVGFYGHMPVAQLDLHPELDDALASAPPNVDYEYVVLHVNAHGYRPEWIDALSVRYRQIREFPDGEHYARPQKVLVFQAKATPIRSARATGP